MVVPQGKPWVFKDSLESRHRSTTDCTSHSRSGKGETGSFDFFSGLKERSPLSANRAKGWRKDTQAGLGHSNACASFPKFFETPQRGSDGGSCVASGARCETDSSPFPRTCPRSYSLRKKAASHQKKDKQEGKPSRQQRFPQVTATPRGTLKRERGTSFSLRAHRPAIC